MKGIIVEYGVRMNGAHKKTRPGPGFLDATEASQLQVAIIRWLGERSPALGARGAGLRFFPLAATNSQCVQSYRSKYRANE